MRKQLEANNATWLTREGKIITIKAMTTTHLLNTIHMIERNRMNDLIQVHGMGGCFDALTVYAEWIEGYDELIKEAKRRNLIGR